MKKENGFPALVESRYVSFAEENFKGAKYVLEAMERFSNSDSDIG